MTSRIVLALFGASALVMAPMALDRAVDLPEGFSAAAHAQGASEGRGGGRGGGEGRGGGNGRGGGEGRGGGMGGGHGIGGGHGVGGPGRQGPASLNAPGHASKGVSGRSGPQSLGDFFGGMVDKARGLGRRDGAEERGKGRSVAARDDRPSPPSLAERQSKALAGKAVPVPEPRQRERNFHAKLAGLNSLNRNYNAYLNAKDPKFAAIQSFVLNSAEYEIAVDQLAALQESQAVASADLAALTAPIATYDQFSYVDVSIDDIDARLADLEAIDPASLTGEEAALVEAEIAALETAIASESYAALTSAAEDQARLESEIAEREALIGEDALTEALVAGANQNRLAEYGDDYVDAEMLGWAEDLLGVGEDYGRIDEVREAIESGAVTTDGDDEAEIAVAE